VTTKNNAATTKCNHFDTATTKTTCSINKNATTTKTTMQQQRTMMWKQKNDVATTRTMTCQ